jgi:hypothetical protein
MIAQRITAKKGHNCKPLTIKIISGRKGNVFIWINKRNVGEI